MAERSIFSNPASKPYDGARARGATFTIQGAAIKSLVLLAILATTFAYTWHLSTVGYVEAWHKAAAAEHVPDKDGKIPPDAISIPDNVIVLTTFGVLGGFLVAMVIIFVQSTAPYLSPVYAALEGLALGAISAGFEAKHPGIAMEAIAATLGMTLVMLLVYATGLIKPTKGFVLGLCIAMFGIVILYLVDIVMGMCGTYVPIVHGNGWQSIVLSLFIVGIASLNLIVDFGMMTEAAEDRAPKSYEWYTAFGLMLTLVWLYLEILRLLGMTSNND